MDFGRASTLEELGTCFLAEVHYYGLSGIEFMLDPRDKRYKLLEVNAYTWGGTQLLSLLGLTLLTDVGVALHEIMRGKVGLNKYLASLKGKK